MIRNESSLNSDETLKRYRAAVEHRATWMGLMCLEAEKAGADWEAIARRAVRETGGLHGGRIAGEMGTDTSMESFARAFIPEHVRQVFEMDILELSDGKLDIEFHYCPLVSAWQKLGMGEEMIATLCDIAMDGDRGIAGKTGLRFKLGRTIARGHHVCEVCFSRPDR